MNGFSPFVCLMSRELVDDDVTLKTGDILHIGQSELVVEISK